MSEAPRNNFSLEMWTIIILMLAGCFFAVWSVRLQIQTQAQGHDERMAIMSALDRIEKAHGK